MMAIRDNLLSENDLEVSDPADLRFELTLFQTREE
jgi:hypothetical protein